MVKQLRAHRNVRAVISFFTKSIANRGRERYRKAGITASVYFVSQGLSVLLNLVSVPLTLRYLDPERYGVWLTINTLFAFLAMTDFGLTGTALVNLIAEADGREDLVLAREYVASAFWGVVTITLAFSLLCLITFSHIPWRTVFHVSARVSTSELQRACGLTFVIVFLGLPLYMMNSVYSAYQNGYLAHAWTIAGTVISFAALIIVTQTHGGLPELVFALSGIRLLVCFASAYYLFFRCYRWLMPTLSAVRWEHIKRLLKLGSKYTVSNLAGLAIFQSQPVIISQMFGPSQVMIFVLALRILMLPCNMAYWVTTPLVSAYGEARARGDWKWIRGAFRNSLFACSVLGLALIPAIAFVLKPFMRLWAGSAAIPNSGLILWLAVYAVVLIGSIPSGQLLNGLERAGRVAVGTVFCAAGTIGLGMLFAKWWGLAGLAIAMVVSVFFACFTNQMYALQHVFYADSQPEYSGAPPQESVSALEV